MRGGWSDCAPVARSSGRALCVEARRDGHVGAWLSNEGCVHSWPADALAGAETAGISA